MKKTLCITACCLLAACTSHREKLQKVEMLPYAKIDTAPLSYIHVAPSQRAIEFKGVNFDNIARRIRRHLADEPIDFKSIRLILVDYAELPALDADAKFINYPCSGQKYFENYNGKSARYYLNLKFYKCNNRPPNTPDRETTVTVDKVGVPPHEAIITMAYEAVRDYVDHVEKFSAKKLEVNMDF